MGWVFKRARGKRDEDGTIVGPGEPVWVAKWKQGGRWKQQVLKGVRTKDHAKRLLASIEANVTEGRIGIEAPKEDVLVGPLLEAFAAQLDNRNAGQDAYRIERHLVPYWKHHVLSSVDVHAVRRWLDTMRVAGKKRDALKAEGMIKTRGSSNYTQASNVTLLSRFFSWCIKHEHCGVNPVLMVPAGERPHAPREERPWLEDERQIGAIIAMLPEGLGKMFYLGSVTGMRPGEIAGLRLGDLATAADGALWITRSYEGALKEDRHGGKGKPVCIPPVAAGYLEPWLARRRAEGAGPKDLVFPGHIPAHRSRAMTKVRAAFGLPADLDWYRATRHSFASRKLKAGASLDEVSRALGHANTSTTARYYAMFVQSKFSPVMLTPLGIETSKGTGGKVVAIRGKR